MDDSPEQYRQSQERELQRHLNFYPPFVVLIRKVEQTKTDYGYGEMHVHSRYVSCLTEAAARELNPAAIYKLIQ